MRLIARGSLGLAAALCLALPAAATATHDPEHPTAYFTKASASCDPTSTSRAPVTVVLRRFKATQTLTAKQVALQAIGAETGWPAVTVPQNEYLYMTSSSGNQCGLNQPTARQVVSGSQRTRMLLWGTDEVVAGTPIRQTQPTGGCPDWTTAPNGYNLGRDSFETAFQGNAALGTTAYEGPYPVQLVYWGNTQPIQQCGGTAPSSDGNVSVIHPKDEFGVHENLQRDAVREDPPAGSTFEGVGNCPAQAPAEGQIDYRRRTAYGGIEPDVIDQWQALGVTTVRFGLDWRSVAPCSLAGDVETDWAWQLWDPVIADLEAAGIEPIIMVKSPPPTLNPNNPNQPKWIDPACPDDFPSGLVNTNGGLGAWRDFVEHIAREYGDTARAIQVWNEPNSSKYWGGCDPRSDNEAHNAIHKYMNILKWAAQGVALGQPNPQQRVPLVLAGLTPATPPDDDQVARPWEPYMQDMLSSNDDWGELDSTTQQAVEAVGLHPYRTLEDLGNPNTTSDDIDTTQSALNQFRAAREIVAERTNPDRDVWVTEVGTTHTGDSGDNSYVGASPLLQGFADWAIYDTLRNAGAPASVVFRFADRDDVPSSSPQAGYGIVESAPQPPQTFLPPKFGYCMLTQERTQLFPPDPPNTAC